MAERRMFSKRVVESARFLKMPVSSQNLYFHLGMNADDDGIVEAYSVINLVKAHEDDLRVLFSKGFVKVLNEDLVTYIADWKEQNKIRPDRKKDSIYKGLLLQMEPGVVLLEKKERSDVKKKNGPSMDSEMSAQCSVGQERVGKDRLGKESVVTEDRSRPLYTLGNEILTVKDYEELTDRYTHTIVDGVIRRILGKPYHGCLNLATINAWCREQIASKAGQEPQNITSVHSEQLNKLALERRGDADEPEYEE